MPLRNLVWLIVVPSLVMLGLAIGFSAPPPDKDYQLVRQVVDVISVVDKNYVKELSDEERQKFVEAMINGGLKELDKNCEFLNAKRLKEFDSDTEGNFGGIGITLATDPKTHFLRVDHPMPGTPAYDAGVIANDLIVKVGDTSTENMKIEDARKLITGVVGTPVVLTIRRGDRADFPVTVKRGNIELHPVTGVARLKTDPLRWEWFIDPKDKIALIRISTFNGLTSRELRAAMVEIEAAGGRALILDLRDNPGGLLKEAIEVCDLFLTEGKIVTTKDRSGNDRVISAKADNTLFLPKPDAPHPIAVLINRDSASASEIVSAALQDHNRAIVIGERSYGKGSVQKLLRIQPEETTAVKLTTESYWRPSGKNIHRDPSMKESDEWGVQPNPGMEVLVPTEDRIRYEFEARSSGYVAGKPDIVGANPPPRIPPIVPKGTDGKPLFDDSKPFEDKALNKAIDVLRKKLAE